MLVEIDQLCRNFGNFKAIENVSFSFDAGHIYGFIGPNGAGKTTTMRILATLDIATTGDAYVDGLSVTDYPEKIRKMLGFMPDYYGAPSNTTIFEYLDFFARCYDLKGAKRKAAVEYVIDFMDMRKIQDKLVSSLSKGMKQRLCLGRTLINDPKVLILDEPAAGLDPRARIELRELLKILANNGKAILISSHILTELGEICDSCAIIEQGHILHAGAIEDISEERMKAVRPKITLTLFEGNAEMLKILSEVPFVEKIEEITVGKKYKMETEEINKAPLILKALIERGVPVLEYYLEGQNLESLFLNVTKGEVQ